MEYKEALKYAMDLCSRQERCRSEIEEKLSSRKIPVTEIKKILNSLEKENFIDETRYAGSYTRDKLRFNHWGKIKIRQMLRGKKIPEPIIDEALGAVDPEDYAGILKEELAKKRKTLRGGSPLSLKGRLFRFARQRGFETGLIYSVLNEIL